MAIVQISRITNRKGLSENLPQLAGAELGWCTDTRQLFIGNGTIEDGAPVIGNTEILTQYSDIARLVQYTYRDDEYVGPPVPQTGPSLSSPTIRPISYKLDDTVSVRDFGALGNNYDDTDAIERALFELYCTTDVAQARRALFFPAGIYKVTRKLRIPTWARLVGEGMDSSIILLSAEATDSVVAEFVDSKNQSGVNIGVNEAIPPRNIEIASLTFQSEANKDIFLVYSATDCWFSSVGFRGAFTADMVTEPGSTDFAAVRFNNTSGTICSQIVFDRCTFANIAYGFDNQTSPVRGITVSDSMFDTLYHGVYVGGSSTGYRVIGNFFNNVYAEAIVFGSELNVSANNIFYNVGNNFGANPATPVISFFAENNVSAYDLFDRTDAEAAYISRIAFLASGTANGGTGIQNGRYARESGKPFLLINNQTTPAVIATMRSVSVPAFHIDYSIVRGTSKRFGRITIMSDDQDNVEYSDEYVMNSDDGVVLSAQAGSIANTVDLVYTTTNNSNIGTLTYSISYLNNNS